MTADRQKPEPEPGPNPQRKRDATHPYGVHHAPTIELIQQLSAIDAMLFTQHATDMLFERWLTVDVLRAALSHEVRVLEDYPDDPRGHSCLIEGRNRHGDLLHCTCAIVEDDEVPGGLQLLIITVFVPD